MIFPRLWCGLLLGLVLGGCSHSDLDTVYGRRRGASGGASVNGVGVLAGMFEAAGHKVMTKRHLCPKFQDYQLVVWAPDDFAPPREQDVQFFENWFRTGRGRTLIYVGRDYDATLAYWEKILPTTPPDQAVESLRRWSTARAADAESRQALPAEQSCAWFRIERDQVPRRIETAASGGPGWKGRWSESPPFATDPVDLRINARFEPPEAPATDGGSGDTEILLAAGPDVFVRRLRHPEWRDGQLIVVTNGSFLLNLPLVERGHRKLAAELIKECGSPASGAIFLESEQGGPPLVEREPGESQASGFEAFTVWPLGAILWHAVAVGLLYLLSRLPIFGRAQGLPADSVSDFGKHVHALGELLARTQESAYAERRLQQYQEQVKRDSGAVGKLPPPRH